MANTVYYFGRTSDGLPGLPGGGMTGVVPGLGFGAGTSIPGSMPPGGWITPSFRFSCLLRDSPGAGSDEPGAGSLESGIDFS